VVPPGKRLRTFSFAWDLRCYDFSGFDVLNAHGDDWFLWAETAAPHPYFHGSCMAEMLHAKGLTAKARMARWRFANIAAASLRTSWSRCRRIRGAISDGQTGNPNGVDLGAFSPGDEKSAAPALLLSAP